MDVLKTAMRIIFVEQDPVEIIRNALQMKFYTINKGSNISIPREKFVDEYLMLDGSRTWNEVSNIMDVISEIGDIWQLLYRYANEKLSCDGSMIYCNYKDLLKWTQMTRYVESDIFVTALLSKNDMINEYTRYDFTWPCVLPCNNVRLRRMLSQGMAENHFHLKGSADTFRLSWIAIMNDIHLCDNVKLDYPAGRLSKDSQKKLELQILLAIAAIIRVYLFVKLFMGESCAKDELKDELFERLEKIIFADNPRTLLDFHLEDIQSVITGVKYSQNHQDKNYDYAIFSELYQGDKTTAYYVGERAFLYKVMTNLSTHTDKNTQMERLFLGYLIIKNKFMAELVQSNSRSGFANFAMYQDRKGKYLKKNKNLLNLVEPIAIVSSIKYQNIVSLEARLVPKFTAKGNCKLLQDLDERIKKMIDEDDANSWKNNSIEDKLFYVFHFPKEQDEWPMEGGDVEESIFVRHRKLREKVRKWTQGIIELRRGYPQEAGRVAGIDACANEIDARPEVFGQAFRCLKHHVQDTNAFSAHYKQSLPNLRLTYHVGEDFLDVVDGLRAIEEAILFLGLSHGDRLGHAVALGIKAEEWYAQKDFKVCLSKHDLLDNNAWLLWHLRHDGYRDSAGLSGELKDNYANLWTHIYGQMTVPDIDTYIKAWQLRGNNPEVYKKNSFQVLSYWDRYACSDIVTEQNEESPCVDLFKRYHTIEIVRKGSEKCVYKVSKRLLNAIEFVQKRIQDNVSAKGIGLECNPTSNVRISNFARYDRHPIMNLYNLGLTVNPEDLSNCPQLLVSINTDDQGIFSTNLENEYALMGLALEKKKDKYGMPLYKQAMIYDWLDRIRKMGLEQSFNSISFQRKG